MSEKDPGEKRFETDEDLSQVEIPELLPVLPLRGIVIFPSQVHPFLVSRAASLKLIEEVGGTSVIIGLASQKNPEEESPAPEGLYPRGTAVRILKMLKYPDQSVRVLVQGLARIELGEFIQHEPYFRVIVTRLEETFVQNRETDALQANLVSQFSKFVSLVPYLPDELQVMAMQVREPGRLTDLVASYLKIAVEELQDILGTLDVRQRLEKLIVILSREIELLELGHKIQSQVQTELNKNQREYYLRQQLNALNTEHRLGQLVLRWARRVWAAVGQCLGKPARIPRAEPRNMTARTDGILRMWSRLEVWTGLMTGSRTSRRSAMAEGRVAVIRRARPC